MDIDGIEKLGDPIRRMWMLWRAASENPFEQAIELARAAEKFVLGTETETETEGAQKQPYLEPQKPEASALMPVTPTPKSRLNAPKGVIKPEEREAIISRIVAGHKNADILPDYPHLTMRQIQGIRMGSSRRIKSTSPLATIVANKPAEPEIPVPVESVVRYLRQQDDVVVKEGKGWLVNNRFRLSDLELLDRANRMRSRKQEPLFSGEDETRAAAE